MKKTLMLLVLPLLAFSLVAQEIPIQNWSAPSTFRPEGRIGAMADISPGIPFVAVTPCRVYDSRSGTILSGGGTRTVAMDGGTCALPSGAAAYSIHITAFGSVASTNYGFITVYPAGATRPVVSTMNFLGGSQTSSAAIVPAGSGSDIAVYTTTTTHFVVDVNGYYTEKFPPSNQFSAESTSQHAAILGVNNTATNTAHAIGGYAGGAAVVYGIQGQVGPSTLAGSSGIHGKANSNSNRTYGVFGQSGSTASNAAGVFGYDKGGAANSTASYITAGVRGESGNDAGLMGVSNYIAVVGNSHDSEGARVSEGGLGWLTTGVLGTTRATGARAIDGHATLSTGGGISYGVFGKTSSIDAGSVGVMGDHHGSWTFASSCGATCTAGVRGRGANTSGITMGVSGEGTTWGVFGVRIVDGSWGTYGMLGYNATEGVYTPNHLTASGGKSFIEPHPREAGKTIRYESLEGPEHGTYFRGRGQFTGRTAVIAVPDYFALVSSPEELSVQVTPIGDFAQVAVTYIGLDRIELKSSRDVEFFFTVNGIRQALPRSRTVEDDQGYFIPRSADDRIEFRTPYPEMQKRLIASGIYNTDGSVNMMTAERMGWAQQWREAEAAAKAAAEAEQQPRSLSEAGGGIR